MKRTVVIAALAFSIGFHASASEVADNTLYSESAEKPTVDVLVAYDNGAQAYVANKGVTLTEFAATQIEKMNAVLATNRLDRYYSYRLAGVCK